MDKREQAIRRRVHRLAEFYQHLVTFIVVISLVWIGNAFLVYGSERAIKWTSWWAIWPTLFWGIGLVCHAVSVLPAWSMFSDDWEERKVREIMEREAK